MAEEVLDLLDRKLLYELDRNSRSTYKQLGKKLGVAKETAAFRVKRLQKNGFIKGFLTTINTSNLNRFYYKLFYKFHKTTPEIERLIVAYIQDFPSIAYFASLEGRYDVTFLILAKDMTDLTAFLVPFRERFGEYVLEQEILTLTNTHRFNFRFFYERGELLHTQYPERLSEPDIDEMDYAILKALAKDARVSLVELAKQLKAQPNAVKYRLMRLRKANIFGTHVLDIDFEKFGVQQIQIDFSLKNHGVVRRLVEFVAQHPKSTFATVMLGKYDLAVEFAVRDMEELRAIMNSIKERFAADITSHDILIMEEHGLNWFPYGLKRES